MKQLFITLFAIMAAASLVTYLTEPNMQSDVPVLYWVTDPNPMRVEQIELFHAWLVENDYTTPDGKPFLELRVDSANSDGNKKIVQGVSGVAGDIMDCSIRQMQEIGALMDVTDKARELGFDMNTTYAALEPLLTVDGRQYGFPCNVASMAFWVNKGTLAAVGMEPPPRSWDFAAFERIGKEYVKRANPPGERQTKFFTHSAAGWIGAPIVLTMQRSLGLSIFNETLTRFTLDDPRYVRILKLIHKWTFEDRIMASAADEISFSSEAGYGGSQFALFQRGNYAMISIGRWCLIRMREFREPINMSVSFYPADQFPNAPILTRAAGVYAAGKNKDKAALFLAFLASESYNDQILRSADSLPPNPIYTDSEAFRRPEAYPNEWGCHEVPAAAARTIAIGPALSPFVQDYTVTLFMTEAYDKVMADLLSPEKAVSEMSRRINTELQRNLNENPVLRAKYDEQTLIQKKIDQRREQGQKVPLDWIANPFHKRYYVHKGWAEEK